MLDFKAFKKNPDFYIQGWAARGAIFDRSFFEACEKTYHAASQLLQSYQTQRNDFSERIGHAKSKGLAFAEWQEQVCALKAPMEQAEVDFHAAELEWLNMCHNLPNIPDRRVPLGTSEEDNVVTKIVGTPQRLEGGDHTEILKSSGLLMMEAGANLSGARFNVLKGPLATLHRALIQFMLHYHETNGQYEEYYVPFIVQRSALFGTGQLPKFEEDVFHLEGDRDLFLIPTAEVPLTNLFANAIHPASLLPKRMMAHTPCFRSEVGSYGRDMKGIFRQHQFEKIELVHCVTPEQADSEFDFLVQHVSAMLTQLELPHQMVNLCTKDLGFSSCRTVDIEVWMPGQKKYREISSCSQFGDFQARRMKARYRESPKAPTQFMHTMNGSGVAVGRALIALVENHGDEKGCWIPPVLRPFIGQREFLSWVKE